MRDRIAELGKENRVKITLDDGSVIEGVLDYADNASQEGSIYNKANVLPDATALKFGLGSTAEPKDIFDKCALLPPKNGGTGLSNPSAGYFLKTNGSRNMQLVTSGATQGWTLIKNSTLYMPTDDGFLTFSGLTLPQDYDQLLVELSISTSTATSIRFSVNSIFSGNAGNEGTTQKATIFRKIFEKIKSDTSGSTIATGSQYATQLYGVSTQLTTSGKTISDDMYALVFNPSRTMLGTPYLLDVNRRVTGVSVPATLKIYGRYLYT